MLNFLRRITAGLKCRRDSFPADIKDEEGPARKAQPRRRRRRGGVRRGEGIKRESLGEQRGAISTSKAYQDRRRRGEEEEMARSSRVFASRGVSSPVRRRVSQLAPPVNRNPRAARRRLVKTRRDALMARSTSVPSKKLPTHMRTVHALASW